jgi:hypothetical protein
MIFAPIASKQLGITGAQPAPVSPFAPGSGLPSIRTPSFQISPVIGA